MAISVSQADIAEAESFLVTYLTEKIPEADFSPGSAMRDLCISSVAHVFAFLRKELQSVKARQSLAGLVNLPPDEDRDEAVDAVLSNLFIHRRDGTRSTVTATLYFTSQVAFTLPWDTNFAKADGTVFRPSSGVTLTYPAARLEPVTLGLGQTYYRVRIPLTAASTGASGNVSPGRFSSVTAFSGQFAYAENESYGANGSDIETTDELIRRAPDAIATRNLVNAKSIRATLMERFDALSGLDVVGHGDLEMRRDLVKTADARLRIHTGGMVDVFARLPRTSITETRIVGESRPRADGLVTVLRDTTVDFTALTTPIREGKSVLRLWSGIDGGLTTYVISAVRTHEIEVNGRTPFPEATDEAGATVDYSIGHISPDYLESVPRKTTGETSRKISQSGAVVLSDNPVYAVTAISGLTTPLVRVNGTPVADNEYSLAVVNPESSQSLRAVTLLRLPASVAAGTSVQVTYDSVMGVRDLDAYVSDDAERTLAADLLVRAYHPVYVGCVVGYTVRVGGVDPGVVTVQRKVQEYFEGVRGSEPSVGDLLAYLVRELPDLSQVTPPTITYNLMSADGQVLSYETSDVLSVWPSVNKGARLLNPAALVGVGDYALTDAAVVAVDTDTRDRRSLADDNLARYLSDRSVSPRTVRYLVNLDDVTVVRR